MQVCLCLCVCVGMGAGAGKTKKKKKQQAHCCKRNYGRVAVVANVVAAVAVASVLICVCGFRTSNGNNNSLCVLLLLLVVLLWLSVSRKNEVDLLFGKLRQWKCRATHTHTLTLTHIPLKAEHFRTNLHRPGREIMHASVDIEMPSRLNSRQLPAGQGKSQEKPSPAQPEARLVSLSSRIAICRR